MFSQASKVYRHPGLLKYIDGGIVGGDIIVVTELATPLHKHDLKAMPALQITAGLAAIMNTLIFLHDRVCLYSLASQLYVLLMEYFILIKDQIKIFFL